MSIEDDMEIISVEWCEKHNFKKKLVDVVRDVTFYYESPREFVISYTQSITGLRCIAIGLSNDRDYIAYECKHPMNVSTLKKMCELISIDYPFNDLN